MRIWRGLSGRLLGAGALAAVLVTLSWPGVIQATGAEATIRFRALPPATAATPPPYTPPPAEVRIAAVGDLMFARDIVDLTEGDPGYPFARVAGLFAGVDLLVGNLEGTLTDRGAPLEKMYTFRAPPDRVASLTAAGFHAVTLGNNHVGDFGGVSVTDTMDALDGADIEYAGAGEDAAAAQRPALLRTPRATVALLSYSGVGESAFAGVGRPGVARASIEAMADDVRAARALTPFVVVALHAGTEYQREPTAFQRDFNRAAIEAGAALVIGHHPHVLQGWERHGAGVILYSLGNFVFDLEQGDMDTLGRGPFETGVAVVTLRLDAPPAVEFRPAMIDVVENRPRPATDAEAARIASVFRELTAAP
ncbi:MAG: CapA family protein [Dehalococcoidia bacterium]